MVKKRVPMQVSPNFNERIKKLKQDIMKRTGMVISERDLTERIATASDFDAIEKKLLAGDINNILNLDGRAR